MFQALWFRPAVQAAQETAAKGYRLKATLSYRVCRCPFLLRDLGNFFALSFISTTYILWILMSGVLVKFKSSGMPWSCLFLPPTQIFNVASPQPCPASFTSFLFLGLVYGECFPLRCLVLFCSFSFSFHISNFFFKKSQFPFFHVAYCLSDCSFSHAFCWLSPTSDFLLQG